jgi:cytochrome c oxidase cbb3-type subunit III
MTAHAQTPPAAKPRPGGGFIPGQQRHVGDPAQVERGSKLYGLVCRSCHGADLRGGDMGGPNLLRSMLALSDREGENIVPVINGSMAATGMPAIKMSPDDAKAVAAYVRSVLAMIGGQGRPPSTGKAPETVVVGVAAKGEAYFQSKCAGCHSATGDLKGIASKYPDPKILQNTWVAGGGRFGRGPAPSPGSEDRRAVKAKVHTTPGTVVEGRVLRIDDFNITLMLADGSQRTFTRNGDIPKVEINDPLQAHRDLLSVYTDDDMHNVTAWLVTLK